MMMLTVRVILFYLLMTELYTSLMERGFNPATMSCVRGNSARDGMCFSVDYSNLDVAFKLWKRSGRDSGRMYMWLVSVMDIPSHSLHLEDKVSH